ncbi:glycerate dehydrogenase/hypothetical protein [Acinetobacter calcoaceticus]|uniref:Glycerate dehydrogenase n=1 Tax=Acinetobacter calcoaceticus TaxID=471 RepID=A0A4V2R051_ACICA|nr:glycerate dehydrogenase/hypothetical protein [Acinetobacter calcoaceticus]
MQRINLTYTEEKYLSPDDFNCNFKFDFDAKVTRYQQLSQQQFHQDIYDQDILVVNDLMVDQPIFEHNPNLKLIALCSTGYEQVDLALAQHKGVKVCNIRGYAADTVAEHAFLLMMSLMRNLMSYHQSVIDGRWYKSQSFSLADFPIFDLKGKTLVIVGKGEIGQSLALKATAFGMQVIYAERKGCLSCRAGYMPFNDAIQIADVISLHCPLQKDRPAMIDLDCMLRMKSSCYLINVSRGALVNEHDLVWALKHQLIAGYAADVIQPEPPPQDHPLLQAGLNVLLTPHIAWSSFEAKQRMFHILNQNINLNMQGIDHNRVV